MMVKYEGPSLRGMFVLSHSFCHQSYFFPLLAPFLDLFTFAFVGLLFFATTGLAAAFLLAAGFFDGDTLAFFFGEASAVLRGLGGPLLPFLGLYASSSSSSSDSSSLSDAAA